MGHAAARTVFGFSVARFALGLGEAGNFPASIKTVAEWFPKKERALATGLFNSGSNIGATVAPILVPWLAMSFGWRWAFVGTGALGFIWLALWWSIYRSPAGHPRVSAAELNYIRSDPQEPTTRLAWRRLLPHRQTWGFALAKFLTDPIWWFYLYWLPGFFSEKHGLDLTTMGPPLVVIYLLADIGSIGGGWLSSFFLKRGWPHNKARKTAMLCCALCVVPVVFASKASSLWGAVAIISLAAAAHQGWSANLFTTVSDMFPQRAVGSVVGLGGMLGAVGGMCIAKAAGHILEWTNKNYLILFVLAGSAYLLALLIFHLLAPRMDKVEVS
jgi:ACS family hexuronate transporter-like MFS transporter